MQADRAQPTTAGRRGPRARSPPPAPGPVRVPRTPPAAPPVCIRGARRGRSATSPRTEAPLEASSASVAAADPVTRTTSLPSPSPVGTGVGVGAAASSASKRSHQASDGVARPDLGALVRVELAQDDPRLDGSVPVIQLEADGGVDDLVVLDAEPGAPEGDAERPVRAAVQIEACVSAPFPHRPHVADPGAGDQQPHPWIAHPEGAEPAELLGQLEPEIGAADHRVDPLRAGQVLGAEDGGRVGREGLAKGVEVLGSQLQPGGRPVATEGGQVLGAGLEPGEQVEPGDAATRAPAPAFAVEGDHDRRPVMALDHARGDDPDHARVPALAGDDDRRRLHHLFRQLSPGGLGGVCDLALGRPALAVCPTQLIGDLGCPTGVLGEKQLDPGIGPVEPSRGVDPWRQPEGQVALVEPGRLAFRRFHQCLDSRPLHQPHLLQSPLDQRPVLADQRHDVRHRRQRHEVELPLRVTGGGSPGSLARGVPGDPPPGASAPLQAAGRRHAGQ